MSAYFEHLYNIVLILVVYAFSRTMFPGQIQTFLQAINRNHPFGTQQKRALNGELTNRTTAEYCYYLPGLDCTILRRHITGWKDIGEEKDLPRRSVPVCLSEGHQILGYHGR